MLRPLNSSFPYLSNACYKNTIIKGSNKAVLIFFEQKEEEQEEMFFFRRWFLFANLCAFQHKPNHRKNGHK